ncbi:MAG: hypothetical protein ACI9R3_004187 [Verrucomicrobiales bacterium]
MDSPPLNLKPPSMKRVQLFRYLTLAATLSLFAGIAGNANAGSISGEIVYEGAQDGTLIVQTWQSKPGNRALQVDGDGDYVVVDTLTNLSGSEITVQYWFRGSSFQSAVRQQSGGWIVAGWTKKDW